MLPLFPDLLEQSDSMRRNVNYLQRGFAVWCIDDFNRCHSDDLSELICLVVIYDNMASKRWIVEIKHHYYEFKIMESGWGNSRSKERKLHYSAKIHGKAFASREEAVDFAERVKLIFCKFKRAKERGSDE